MVAAHMMQQAQVSQISAGTCSYALPRALDWLLQPVLLDSTTSSCCCTFSSNFCVVRAMAEQLCSIHGETSFLKAKFGTTPQRRPQNDLNLGVSSSYGTNKPPLPNPSFPYEVPIPFHRESVQFIPIYFWRSPGICFSFFSKQSFFPPSFSYINK